MLAFAARHGKACLVAGLLAGLLLPGLASAMRPWLPLISCPLLLLACSSSSPVGDAGAPDVDLDAGPAPEVHSEAHRAELIRKGDPPDAQEELVERDYVDAEGGHLESFAKEVREDPSKLDESEDD